MQGLGTVTMFTLKQLEAFYWSGVLGSFSTASAKLHTTQSAIAKRVTELENIVGSPLLERRPRALIPTSQGRQLLALAEEMLAINNKIVRTMVAANGLEGIVRLGATELVSMTWFAQFISEAQRQYPRVQLLPDIDGGVTLYQRLQDGSLDLAIMPGPFWSHDYECVWLGSVSNAWMASPSLQLDKKNDLSPQDLLRFPVISQPNNSALSHLYDAWFTEQGLAINRVLTCNSLGVVAQLTALGLGISFLPRSYFRPLVERGELCELNVTPDLPKVHYYIVYRKSVLSPVSELLIELARKVCNFDLQGVTPQISVPGQDAHQRSGQ